jgi:hypothetical protein
LALLFAGMHAARNIKDDAKYDGGGLLQAAGGARFLGTNFASNLASGAIIGPGGTSNAITGGPGLARGFYSGVLHGPNPAAGSAGTPPRRLPVGWWPSHPVEPINGVMISNHYHTAVGPSKEPWPLAPGMVHPERLADTLAVKYLGAMQDQDKVRKHQAALRRIRIERRARPGAVEYLPGLSGSALGLGHSAAGICCVLATPQCLPILGGIPIRCSMSGQAAGRTSCCCDHTGTACLIAYLPQRCYTRDLEGQRCVVAGS